MIFTPIQSESLRVDCANTYVNTINNAFLVVCWNTEFVSEYINYIAQVIMDVMKRNNFELNIILATNNKIGIDNTKKTIYININFEHSCVKEKYPNGTYLDNLNKFTNSDIIVDYSIPNIHNVRESMLCENLAKKMVYVGASLYDDLYISKENRHLSALTTFIAMDLPRRVELRRRIREKRIYYLNVTEICGREIFDKTVLKGVYKKTKVLVNIHQCENRNTLEELRVLSALQCGVLVIAEESAYTELIPYHNLIIWSSYESIVEKLAEVLENYDSYHSKIFCEENVNILAGIHSKNVDALEEKILACV